MPRSDGTSSPSLATTAAALALILGGSTPISTLRARSIDRPATTKQLQAFLLRARTGSVQGGYRANYVQSYNITSSLNPGHLIHLQAIQDTPYLRIYRLTPGFRSAQTGTAPAGYEVFLSMGGPSRPRLQNAPPGTYTCSRGNLAERWSCTTLGHVGPAEQTSLADWFPGFELFNELSNAFSYYSFVPPVLPSSLHRHAAAAFLANRDLAGERDNCLTIKSPKSRETLGQVCLNRHDQVAYLELPISAVAGVYKFAVMTQFSEYVPLGDLRLPALPRL